MAQTNVTIRMDEDLKKQFDAFCHDIGMNMTTAFCVFAKTVVRERKIPFELSLDNDPFYSPATMAELMEAKEALDAGKGVEHDIEELLR